MSTSAEVKLLVSQENAIASLNQFASQVERMAKRMDAALRQNRAATKGVGDEISNWRQGFANAASGLTSMLSVMLVMRKVAEQIKFEFQEKARVEREALGKQISYSDAFQDLAWQWPRLGGDKFPIEKVKEMIDQSEVADKVVATNVVKSATSAGLAIPLETRVKLALGLAELRPDLARRDPAGLAELAGVVAVQMRTSGQSEAASLGMVTSALSAARQTELKQFAENIAPLYFKLKPMGFTQQESLAIGAAYSSAIEDTEGATTATNVQTFLMQLQGLLRSSNDPEVRAQAEGMKMLEFIRSDHPEAERLRNYLAGRMRMDLSEADLADTELMYQLDEIDKGGPLGHIMGRMKGKAAWYSFLTKKGDVEDTPESMAHLLKAALSEIPKDDAAAEALTKQIKEEYKTNRMNMAAQFKTAYENMLSQTDLASTDAAVKRQINDALKDIYTRSKTDYLPATRAVIEKSMNIMADSAMDETQSAEEVLTDFQDVMREEARRQLMDMKGGPMFGSGARFKRATGVEMSQATAEDWRRFHEIDKDWNEEDWKRLEALEEFANKIDELITNSIKGRPGVDPTYQGDSLARQELKRKTEEGEAITLNQKLGEMTRIKTEQEQLHKDRQADEFTRNFGGSFGTQKKPLKVEVVGAIGIHQAMRPKPEQPAAANLRRDNAPQ